MPTDLTCDEIVAFWATALQASNTLERRFDEALRAKLGLTLTRYALLSAISTLAPGTQQELTHTLNITKGSVSRQIEAAVANGHLTATASPASRRENAIALTEEGRRLVVAADALLVSSAPAELSQLGRGQFDEVLAALALVAGRSSSVTPDQRGS